jgi:hypothetical protein
MRAPRLLSTVLLAAIVAAACADASPSSEPDGPVEALVNRDGVSVILAIDRGRIAAGDDLTATVTVRNVGPDPVTWQGGGCELQGTISVTPAKALPQPPAGPVVGGGEAAIRQLVLPDASTIRWPTPPEVAHRDIAWGCPANLAFNELLPGDETRATVVWVASTVAGSPAPAGDYLVEVGFPFMGRGLANPPADFRGDRDVDPITARLVVSVEGGPPAPSAEDAVDTILGDPAFAAALEEHPRRIWESVALRWVDGGWVVQVRYRPGSLLEGRLDPATGRVLVRDGLEAGRLN